MQRLNWIDLVRKYYPAVHDDVAEAILWETTCFPMGSPAQVEKNLQENVDMHGQDVEKCMDYIYEKMALEMSQHRMWEILQEP